MPDGDWLTGDGWPDGQDPVHVPGRTKGRGLWSGWGTKRYCLYPTTMIGREYRAPRTGDPFAFPTDYDWDVLPTEDASSYDDFPGYPNTCRREGTDRNGSCPLHAQIPWRRLSATDWERVKELITARRNAGHA